MEHLGVAAEGGLQRYREDVGATTAGIAAAEAMFSGVSRHAVATWHYLNTVCRVEDETARRGRERTFGSAFRAAYAAHLVKAGLSKDGIDAAKKALSRVRASARRLMEMPGDNLKLLSGPNDIVSFGAQTAADRVAGCKRRALSGAQQNALCAAFERFNQSLMVIVEHARGAPQSAMDRHDTTWGALRSEMANIGWGK